jgi:NAD(P)-dependent dehydrogenase (short-subunit alcohol dehydrogenase family)
VTRKQVFRSHSLLESKMNNAIKGLVIGGLGIAAVSRIVRKMNAPSFAGRTALITGGSRGLGLTIARRLADEGANLAIIARTDEELEVARQELTIRGARVLAIRSDMTRKASCIRAVKDTVAEFGALDILIHNAGVIQAGPQDHMTDRDYAEAMKIHFWASHYLTQAAIEHLEVSPMPRIVNISSVGGEVAVPHLAPYTASKFALTGYSDAIRAELAPGGIRVTTVNPGLMRTGSHVNALFKGRREEEYAWFALSTANPLLSTTAERAARRIVEACRHGRPSLIITLPARLGIAADALAPNVVARATSIAARLLPDPAEDGGDEAMPGHELDQDLAPSTLTALADREISRHNENRQ